EVGREVQREAMADHRAIELDADRRELLASSPDPRQSALAGLRLDPELMQVLDQRTLQRLDVAGDGEAQAGQVEDGVAHQRARAGIGGLRARGRRATLP